MSTISQVNNPPATVAKVIYGGVQLVPAPLIEWGTEINHDSNTKVRSIVRRTIKLTGTSLIVPNGSYEQMQVMRESIEAMFATDALEFQVLAGAGNSTLAENDPIVSGLYPMVENINFDSDVQFNRLDYTVDLLVESNSVSGQLVTDLSDTWDLSENANGAYLEVSHSVSAKGINTLASGTNAIHNARDTVYPLLGLSNLPYYLPYYTEPNASGGQTVGIYEVSLQRTENADTLGGSYAVTEKFIIASGTDTYTHERTSSYEENENGIINIGMNGNIQGLGRTNLNTDGGIGYERALAGFGVVRALFASDASGVYSEFQEGAGTLYTFNPVTLSITKNKYNGTVQYNVSYSDDPKDNLPSGIVEATSSIQRNEAARLYASHPIPFRRLGNIVQDIKTTTEGQVVISASAKAENTGDASSDVNRAIAYIQDEVNRLRPNPVSFQSLRLGGGPSVTYSDKELTAQVSVIYAFVVDLSSVNSADSDIVLTSF
jgi:hypothetical protein